MMTLAPPLFSSPCFQSARRAVRQAISPPFYFSPVIFERSHLLPSCLPEVILSFAATQLPRGSVQPCSCTLGTIPFSSFGARLPVLLPPSRLFVHGVSLSSLLSFEKVCHSHPPLHLAPRRYAPFRNIPITRPLERQLLCRASYFLTAVSLAGLSRGRRTPLFTAIPNDKIVISSPKFERPFFFVQNFPYTQGTKPELLWVLPATHTLSRRL